MIVETYKVTVIWKNHYENWEYYLKEKDAINAAKYLASELKCYELSGGSKWESIDDDIRIEISSDVLYESTGNVLPDSYRQLIEDYINETSQ